MNGRSVSLNPYSLLYSGRFTLDILHILLEHVRKEIIQKKANKEQRRELLLLSLLLSPSAE